MGDSGHPTQLRRFSSGGTYKTNDYCIECTQSEFTVGPIPFHDGLGREVVSRWDTDLASQATWYTDSNGRDMMVRSPELSLLIFDRNAFGITGFLGSTTILNRLRATLCL